MTATMVEFAPVGTSEDGSRQDALSVETLTPDVLAPTTASEGHESFGTSAAAEVAGNVALIGASTQDAEKAPSSVALPKASGSTQSDQKPQQVKVSGGTKIGDRHMATVSIPRTWRQRYDGEIPKTIRTIAPFDLD